MAPKASICKTCWAWWRWRSRALKLTPMACDVESRGEVTRGMTVFDTRWGHAAKPNLDVVTEVDVAAVRRYIGRVLYGNSES